MSREEIYNTIRSLAQSQGVYGRLLSAIDSMDEATLDEFYSELVYTNISTPVDLVMYLEG